jgi:hypothetical protein
LLLADAGIPLIGPAVVLGWFAIIPVVLSETVLAKVLLRWRLVDALRWVSLANGVSTLLGIPIAWFLAVVMSALTGGGGWGDGSVIGVLRSPAWLGPGYIKDLGWAIPLALIVLCVPCFFISWWVEFAVLRRVVPDSARDPGRSLWAYAWKANVASYCLLVSLLLLKLAVAP